MSAACGVLVLGRSSANGSLGRWWRGSRASAGRDRSHVHAGGTRAWRNVCTAVGRGGGTEGCGSVVTNNLIVRMKPIRLFDKASTHHHSSLYLSLYYILYIYTLLMGLHMILCCMGVTWFLLCLGDMKLVQEQQQSGTAYISLRTTSELHRSLADWPIGLAD